MRVLFIGYRDARHSSAGGYDKIIGFPGSDYISDQMVPLKKIPVGQRGKSINLFFLDLFFRLKRHKYDISHIFYGDTIIFPYKKSKKNKVVATIHLDLDQRKRFPALFIKALKSLDGVIVLSSQQAAILNEKYGINATFIPHGFSTPKFRHVCLDSIKDGKINVFYSGTNYRDVNALLDILSYCEANRKDVFFHIVGQPSGFSAQLPKTANFTVYNRLTDDEYFSLLSACDYNYLPLTFATANNALLEAQFLGIPSILPSISGISDYAAPSPLNIFYVSREDMEEVFVDLEKVQDNRASELRNYANKFSWENIYKLLERFYLDL